MRLVIALLCCPIVLGAQSPRPKPGARIRFDAPSVGTQLTGTLVTWESDTLVVRVDGDAAGLNLILPGDSIARLDVRRERRLAAEGMGLGLLFGALLAVTASQDWVDENGDCTPLLSCLAYEVSPHLDTRLAILGGVGALVGLAVGSETKTEQWSRVPLARPVVGPAPGGAGLALGVRISF